jgi:hypothetical protein
VRGAANFPVGEEPQNALTKLLLRRFKLILWYLGQKNKFLKIICIFVLIFDTVPSLSNYDFFQTPGIQGRSLASLFPPPIGAHSTVPF